MVIPVRIFRIVNTIFHSLIWKDRPPRIKLEHLQRPKDDVGLELPNPWLNYLAAQLQHLIATFGTAGEAETGSQSSSQTLMLHTVHRGPIPMALEALSFTKPHKQYPTFSIVQKVWHKSKYLQKAVGYTDYSPIWHNDTYTELAKLQSGARWKAYGVTHLKKMFRNGVLHTFTDLKETYNLPSLMHFHYLQLSHAVAAQVRSSE